MLIYETEGRCAGISFWEPYLVVCEGFCRGGAAVAILGLCWELWRAAIGRRLTRFMFLHLKGGGADTWLQVFAKTAGASFTLALGIMSFDRSTAEWIQFYAHVCDFACHVVITTALAGLLVDTCIALTRSKTQLMLSELLTCNTDLESHGILEDHTELCAGTAGASVSAGNKVGNSAGSAKPMEVEFASSSLHVPSPVHQPESEEAPFSSLHVARALMMWLVFITTVSLYSLKQWQSLPFPCLWFLDTLNVACWTMVAWSLVEGLIHVFRMRSCEALSALPLTFLFLYPSTSLLFPEDSAGAFDSEESYSS